MHVYVVSRMVLSKHILMVILWWPVRLVGLQTPWCYYTCAVARSTVMVALLGLWMSLSPIFPRQGLWESSCTSRELCNWARDEPEAWQWQGEPQRDKGTSFITTGDFVLISPINKQRVRLLHTLICTYGSLNCANLMSCNSTSHLSDYLATPFAIFYIKMFQVCNHIVSLNSKHSKQRSCVCHYPAFSIQNAQRQFYCLSHCVVH